jgi:hypothetical protein
VTADQADSFGLWLLAGSIVVFIAGKVLTKATGER